SGPVESKLVRAAVEHVIQIRGSNTTLAPASRQQDGFRRLSGHAAGGFHCVVYVTEQHGVRVDFKQLGTCDRGYERPFQTARDLVPPRAVVTARQAQQFTHTWDVAQVVGLAG